MSEPTTQQNEPTKAESGKKPGFFQRIFRKLDASMKQKSQDGKCCGGGGDGKGGKCC